ncbi:J domain-containing protein [Nesterenkonia sp. MY13]|uniref:J domain-containing protein n=1 Tax=Nesterenkonia sedimenti TaxID=1463632 RepID=A0A7X8TLG2_9MICC|nr:J domain-containing protein [Nesterenkonia sedimenti]NLS10863.1 J domain-containing protein [Nesterenkonia sedimenti]
MSEPDFYAVLGVPPEADSATIRSAYRKAARQHHPDRGGSAEEFHRIQAAWEVLGSASARDEYDRRRRQGSSATSATSPAPTEEGAGFTYSRSGAAGASRSRRSTSTRRHPAADQAPVYQPPLSEPEPLNLTLTSQKVHGEFTSRGLFGGKAQRRQQRTAEVLEKHVLSALPAARLFNDVLLTPAGDSPRKAKNAPRVDHVLLCGRTVLLVGSVEVAAPTASWDGRLLRAAGKSVSLPELSAAAKQLRLSLAEEIGGQLSADHQVILLSTDGDMFHPVVEAQGAGRQGVQPLAAGRAIGHLANVLAASAQANLVDRGLMAALRRRCLSPDGSAA